MWAWKFIRYQLYESLVRMSEAGTRKGQRTKKVPKHMQFDDADYGTYLSARTTDQKEKNNSATEIAQIARILQKYVANINQRLRDHQQHEHTDGRYLENRISNEPENKRLLHCHPTEGNAQKPPPISTATSKRGRDGDRSLPEGKNGRSESRRPLGGSKGQSSISGLQPDMHYHALLNEHIRSAYPNISNISPDMLKTLDLPKQLIDAQNTNGKHRQKEEKSKVPQLLRSIKGGKEGKEELKPFKRQSYHVAIAYHIYLKRIKSTNPSPNEIDPTYAARKLRESQNPTSSKH